MTHFKGNLRLHWKSTNAQTKVSFSKWSVSFPLPGKGRGLYASAFIPAGEFVCEYKTAVVYYSKSTYTRYQKEYNINNKGARVAECNHDSKKYYFDTTRRVNQFGVYPNQSTALNCKLYPPLFVRGKLRLSLFSISNINAREETCVGLRGLWSKFPVVIL